MDKISINGKWLRLHVEGSKNGELGFTNNKVLLSHFEPPKLTFCLIYMYTIMQLRLKFQPLNCSPIGLTAPGGLTLGSAPYF